MHRLRRSLLLAVVVAGCHSHGPAEPDDHGPSMSAVRARISTQVRAAKLEEKLDQGRPDCPGIRWDGETALCARDEEPMRIVELRADETAYYCPVDGLYWYRKGGVWLGPFDSGIRED